MDLGAKNCCSIQLVVGRKASIILPVFQRGLNSEHEAIGHQTEHVFLHAETAVSAAVRDQNLKRERAENGDLSRSPLKLG